MALETSSSHFPAPQNIAVYLVGFPGVGKLTIAREMLKAGGFTLVDNHLINNPVLSLVGADGKTPLPSGVWDRIHAIRDIVMDTIEHLSPRNASFILTNYINDSDNDRGLYQKTLDMFARRGTAVYTVKLSCAQDEHRTRISTDDRAARFKMTSPHDIGRWNAEGLIDVDGGNIINLDVTGLQPAESARAIMQEISRRHPKPPAPPTQRSP